MTRSRTTRSGTPHATPSGYVEPVTAATHAADVDVAAVEEHLARYVVSCRLGKAVGGMAVAHEMCSIEAATPATRSRSSSSSASAYLMPLAADRLSSPTTLAAA